MSKRNQRAELLDRCLTLIQRGELGADECLRRHPELQSELQPLLIAAQQLQRQLAAPGPSAQFRSDSLARVLRLTRERLSTGESATKRDSGPPVALWERLRVLLSPDRGGHLIRRLAPGWVMITLVLSLALLSVSVGVAFAASEALPGDSLYGLKRGMERAALLISPTANGDARLLRGFADRRVDELEQLARGGRLGELKQVLADYQLAIDEALTSSGTDPDRLSALEAELSQHELTLTGLLDQVPEQAISVLESARGQAQHGKDVVGLLRAGEHPNETAPGQLKQGDSNSESQPPGQLKREDHQKATPPGQHNNDQGQSGPSGNGPPGQLKKEACATQSADPDPQPEDSCTDVSTGN